jgi:hypothetical protein
MAVQTWYDAGHTRDQCMEEFGFSKRAWHDAVELGIVVPRTPGTQVGPDSTRYKVEKGLRAGKSYRQIADEIGVQKSTVAFHARRLGRPVDDRFNRRYDWDEVQRTHDAGMRALECCEHFGFARATWSNAVATGRIKPRPHVIPLNELLVKGRRTSRAHLKRRLIDAGIKENRCELCGISTWRGKPLNVQLHHKNGDGTDNRLPNLEFLCPNCHSQTDTYGGRNGHRKPDRHLRLVEPEDDEEAA